MLGLDKWLAVTWLVINCKNGASSCEAARALGSPKTASFMDHRISGLAAARRPRDDEHSGRGHLAAEIAFCVFFHVRRE
jgi:hypothetical protein